MEAASDTASEGSEGGEHAPAERDWPAGEGEASWWPFVAAAGVGGLYLGFGLLFLGSGSVALVPPLAGPVVAAGGAGLALVGTFGWLYQAFVADFWTRTSDGEGASGLRFAMLLFLATDVATFGAGFTYYFFIRAGAWPPASLPELLSSLVLVNTAMLLASSLTLHVAHAALEDGDRRRFLALLSVTFLLGVAFVAGQVYEYYEFVVKEGFTLSGGIFASAFFGLTGLHGLHVALGALLLGIVLARALAGQYAAGRDLSVTTVSMYWHFVDAVWVILVAVLYLGASVTV
jgi:cytochrome c oxidase subunit 3